MKDLNWYQEVRDYVLNVANQKNQMAKPVPMDVGGILKKNVSFDESESSGK